MNRRSKVVIYPNNDVEVDGVATVWKPEDFASWGIPLVRPSQGESGTAEKTQKGKYDFLIFPTNQSLARQTVKAKPGESPHTGGRRRRASEIRDGVLYLKCGGRCGEMKPERDFGPSRHSYCRDCLSAYLRERYYTTNVPDLLERCKTLVLRLEEIRKKLKKNHSIHISVELRRGNGLQLVVKRKEE